MTDMSDYRGLHGYMQRHIMRLIARRSSRFRELSKHNAYSMQGENFLLPEKMENRPYDLV